MKNIFIYYLAISAPVPLLYVLEIYSPFGFGIGLLIYVFLYRTITDGLRLVSKGIISKNKIWKLALPFGYRINYFKKLYFQK